MLRVDMSLLAESGRRLNQSLHLLATRFGKNDDRAVGLNDDDVAQAQDSDFRPLTPDVNGQNGRL